MNIIEQTNKLSNDFNNEKLFIDDLKEYFYFIKENLSEINNLKSYHDFKKSGVLFVIMVENEILENDYKNKLIMSCIGYYILSKGLELYSKNSFANSAVQIRQAELLTSRLFIVANSQPSFMMSLTTFNDEQPKIEDITYPKNNDNIVKAKSNFEDLLIYDSGLLSLIEYKLKLPHQMGTLINFNPEIFNYSKKVLEVFKNYTNLKIRYANGENIHKQYYLFLSKKFKNTNKISFDSLFY